MRAWILLAVMLGAVEMKAVEKRETVCYDVLGCFSTDPPFTGTTTRPVAVVPQSPDHIQTKFDLYTRANVQTAQIVDARHPETAATIWTHYKALPTKFLIHGYLDNPATTAVWMHNAKDEFLKQGEYNVIIVDWSHGNIPLYTQSVANTRIVGAQIAVMVKELINTKGVNASSFHIIGHSLGSHVCGYAGERIPGLGRITGLDPAGPFFDDTDPVVRLDPTDAVFVDTIHSDADHLLNLGFGMRKPVGHADFFPNLGHDQPGCTRDPIQNFVEFGLVFGLEEVIACNHVRAVKYFTESINSKCPFLGFPCASEDDFQNGLCHSCSGDGCSYMGFRADQNKPKGDHHVMYFLTTAGHEPFCQYHLDLTLKFNSASPAESGTLSVVVTGSTGSTSRIALNSASDPINFAAGKTYKFSIGVPADVGSVRSVSLSFDQIASITDPLHWNILGLRNPTVIIDEVDVFREEAQEDVHLCSKGLKLEENKATVISTKC